ncbi:MAG: putative ribosome biogenesis GTPase RsgA [Phycisphaerae bacterium]|nr:putative ribosome biogenesis GTPase RsgA [Phycisphaerae bacterium]
MTFPRLESLGLDTALVQWIGGLDGPTDRVLARVVAEHRGAWSVITEAGEALADVAGRLRHQARSRADLPAVGDWAAVSPPVGPSRARIHAVAPRRSRLSRLAPGGRADEQVLAANVDSLLLVVGLDRDFNLRRIERYLSLAYAGGVAPVVVLNKVDLCDDPEARIAAAESVAPGAAVLAISAVTGQGVEALGPLLRAGRTAALLGSSGVGKSTLLNRLLGEAAQAVGGVRESDGRGRHTTTGRQLFMLAGAGNVIDTPGLRELAVWADADSPGGAFDDIDSLAAGCRFRDCTHTGEPGCAVAAALADGSLDPSRYENHLQLRREQEFLDRRRDAQARKAERDKWKSIHKSMRNHPKRGW